MNGLLLVLHTFVWGSKVFTWFVFGVWLPRVDHLSALEDAVGAAERELSWVRSLARGSYSAAARHVLQKIIFPYIAARLIELDAEKEAIEKKFRRRKEIFGRCYFSCAYNSLCERRREVEAEIARLEDGLVTLSESSSVEIVSAFVASREYTVSNLEAQIKKVRWPMNGSARNPWRQLAQSTSP